MRARARLPSPRSSHRYRKTVLSKAVITNRSRWYASAEVRIRSWTGGSLPDRTDVAPSAGASEDYPVFTPVSNLCPALVAMMFRGFLVAPHGIRRHI
jgi:hypothetical protein